MLQPDSETSRQLVRELCVICDSELALVPGLRHRLALGVQAHAIYFDIADRAAASEARAPDPAPSTSSRGPPLERFERMEREST